MQQLLGRSSEIITPIEVVKTGIFATGAAAADRALPGLMFTMMECQ